MATKGLIHVYTGDGKGKTTASVGLAVRASGAGRNVAFVQFMKGVASSEIKQLKALGITVIKAGTITKFVPYMTDEEREQCAREQMDGFEKALAMADSLDVLVLDEMISAVTTGMVPQDRLLDFLRTKPAKLEVVMTGRDVPEPIAALADYLSDIRAVKHPYDQGIGARKGIEM
ncbi:cob(I)yrinic acid a,c-diamide adenosyltransferase [Desulfovibrio sp. OttesenSCG-928-I05]|nr:cob(I)yrinic acid a,c-diamide adenosyltransferase [Desulfovibrio sp. OttesenSCG-928-I05]